MNIDNMLLAKSKNENSLFFFQLSEHTSVKLALMWSVSRDVYNVFKYVNEGRMRTGIIQVLCSSADSSDVDNHLS